MLQNELEREVVSKVTTVQRPCLPPQGERKVDAPPERRGPQCSYSCIQIEHYVVLTPEEILLNLTDAKVFSIGRYRFRRMPFSLKIAQDRLPD